MDARRRDGRTPDERPHDDVAPGSAVTSRVASRVAGRVPFAYVVLRVVPRVERGEYINAGIVVFARPLRFLGARVHLDRARLAALAPDCDPADIEAELEAIARIAAGDESAGPIARMAKPERFHWLASPSSTIVQRSEVHTGLTHDAARTLDHLFETLVATPSPMPRT